MNPATPLEHLKGIIAFVHAADAGSFTLAAKRAGMTKSGIAKGVARLEDKLGVRLVHRTTRSFQLTDEGRAFYASCVRVLGELENAQTAISPRGGRLSGRLRVELPVEFGQRWILPELLRVAEEHPALQVEVSFNDRLVDLVEEGIDLVVRIGAMNDSTGLVARPLGFVTSALCASPDYLARHEGPASLDDLDRHACIVFGRGGRIFPWEFVDAAGQPLIKSVRGRLMFNQAGAVRYAALKGHGITLLPHYVIANDIRSKELVRVLPEVKTRGFPVHAVWPRTPYPSPKVRVAVDALVRRFLPEPPWERPRSRRRHRLDLEIPPIVED